MDENQEPVEEPQVEEAQQVAEGTETQETEQQQQPQIDEKEHNQLYYERRKRQQAERELERLRQQELQQPAQATQTTDTLDFNDDVTEGEWFQQNYQRLRAKEREEEQRLQAQQEFNKVVGSYEQKLKEAMKTEKDVLMYDDIVANDSSPLVKQAILKSEKPEVLLKSLALDNSLRYKINTLNDPLDVAREIIKMESQADIKPSVSSAPDPAGNTRAVTPQQGNNLGSISSQRDYEAEMNKFLYG